MTMFKHWLDTAKAGDKFEYFSGYLAVRRSFNTSVALTADMVWKAAKQGLVMLVQRRLPAGGFSYIAIRTRRRWAIDRQGDEQ